MLSKGEREIYRQIQGEWYWGYVRQIIFAGYYVIVEYHPRIREGNSISRQIDQFKTEYAAFIRTGWNSVKSTSMSYDTFDAALVGAIAHRVEGSNHSADRYFTAAMMQLGGEEYAKGFGMVPHFHDEEPVDPAKEHCPACEGKPESPNNPCSVCGKEA